ncbi:uncharacterized protein LOC112687497 [Sipha flava]|uniref:Uncharacterized protein LOC112687497 n=1 Tax=Sipha flava TaxID=143950 RepID=A0A8B8FZP7_9HEMI|nr:uncharacterized protein LOC112687497 [Sipha flava]
MRFSTFLLCLIIVTILFLNETEARRKILRGRKTITRTYYKSLGIPAWLSITFTGLVILGISGIIYGALQKFIITNNQPPQPTPSSVPLTTTEIH